MPPTVIENCAVATVDPAGTEHARGHLIVDGGRITAVGEGAASDDAKRDARVVDGTGLLATPGLVNSHHHLYQWATRGFVPDGTLFQWLTGLYPVWAQLDADITHHAAKAGLSALALSGCTLSTDHHYVFPASVGAELLESTITAAAAVGIRFHPTRGSMNLGRSQGGLPPDIVTEDHDAILQASTDAIDRWHDPSPDAQLQIALAPCSPFSVTSQLMTESAELARRRGVRLHTHLCETVDEEDYCLEHFGARPADYVADLGWMGDDVWFAHCVHLSSADIALFGRTGVGVAHCPTSNARLGSGIARTHELRAAGVAVGLGVDGAASNEAGTLQLEVHAALMAARFRGGPTAMTVRQALAHGTIHGARCLGRDADLGSLEVGKLADIALWRVDDLGGAGIVDPVAALVLGPPRGVEHLLVGGELVVESGELRTTDLHTVTRELIRVSARQAAAAGAL